MRWLKRRRDAVSSALALDPFDPAAPIGISSQCEALKLLYARDEHREEQGIFQSYGFGDPWVRAMIAQGADFPIRGVTVTVNVNEKAARCIYNGAFEGRHLLIDGIGWELRRLEGVPYQDHEISGVLDMALWGLYGVGKLRAYIAAAGDDIAAIPIADELGGTLADRVRAYRIDMGRWARTVESLRAQLLPTAEIAHQLRGPTDQLWAETKGLHTLANRIAAEWSAVETARVERITMEQAGTWSHGEVMASDSQARQLSAEALADISKRANDRLRRAYELEDPQSRKTER